MKTTALTLALGALAAFSAAAWADDQGATITVTVTAGAAVADQAKPADEAKPADPAKADPAKAEKTPAKAEPVSATPERIAELVKQLGDDDFKVREAAQKELVRIGVAAKSQVEQATKSEDMETRQRAELLMVEIAKLEADTRSANIARQITWSRPFKGGVVGSPVLGDKALYVVSDDAVRAVDIATGKELWSSPVSGTPGVAASGGMVAVTEGAKLTVIDARTGKAKWDAKAASGRTFAAPAMDETAVYVTDSSGKVQALAAADGKELWNAASLAATAAPVRAGKLVVIVGTPTKADDAAQKARFVGYGNMNAEAYDVTTGKIAWQFKSDRPIVATAGAESGTCLLRQSDMVWLDAAGKELWKAALSEPINVNMMMRIDVNGRRVMAGSDTNAPLIRGDSVYLMSSRAISQFAIKNGEKASDAKLDIDELDRGNEAAVQLNAGGGFVMVARAGMPGNMAGCALVGIEGNAAHFLRNGTLAAMDMKTGKTLWTLRFANTPSGPPVMRDGVMYIALGTLGAMGPGAGMGVNGGIVVQGGVVQPDANKPDGKPDADSKELKLEPGVHALKLK